MAQVRKLVLRALIRVDEEEAYSNLVCDHVLRRVPLEERDKAFFTALFYGVLERRVTLDEVLAKHSKTPLSKLSVKVLNTLRLGAYQILYMDKVPQSAAVDESVRLIKQMGETKASGFVNAVLRAVAREGKNCLDFSGLSAFESLSLRYSVPVELARRFCAGYGEELTEHFLADSLGRPPLYLRANNLRTTPEALAVHLKEEGVMAELAGDVPGALSLPVGTAVGGLKAYEQGLFHVQDLSSQMCCMALEAKPGERVLDLCSAPGGKTFTLAQIMRNKGEVVAGDLYEHKIKLVQDGAKRLGLTMIQAEVHDAQEFCEKWGLFDRVLCDVPCSGLGILRRKPEIRYKNVVNLDRLPDLQYRILCQGARYLKEGGRLIYSTCTLNPEENNRIAARFLAEQEEFEPLPLFPKLSRLVEEEPNCLTLFPKMMNSDGFFLAGFCKRGQ